MYSYHDLNSKTYSLERWSVRKAVQPKRVEVMTVSLPIPHLNLYSVIWRDNNFLYEFIKCLWCKKQLLGSVWWKVWIVFVPDTKSSLTDWADSVQISVAFPHMRNHTSSCPFALGYHWVIRVWGYESPMGWADIMTLGHWDVSNDLRVKDHQHRASKHADKTNEFN